MKTLCNNLANAPIKVSLDTILNNGHERFKVVHSEWLKAVNLGSNPRRFHNFSMPIKIPYLHINNANLKFRKRYNKHYVNVKRLSPTAHNIYIILNDKYIVYQVAEAKAGLNGWVRFERLDPNNRTKVIISHKLCGKIDFYTN